MRGEGRKGERERDGFITSVFKQNKLIQICTKLAHMFALKTHLIDHTIYMEYRLAVYCLCVCMSNLRKCR